MILIKGGRVIDPASGLDDIRDVVIGDEGKIVAICENGESKISCGGANDDTNESGVCGDKNELYDQIIDATGCVVAPGFVDVHVHFRDPGLTYKEDIVTGANAAAAGGYTTVICMANTKPAIDSVETFSEVYEREQKLPIHVLQTANVTKSMQGNVLTDMDALKAAGAVGFTDDGVPIPNEKILLNALQKCKELDVPISLHEEDPALMYSPGVNYGKVSKELGLGGATEEAEYVLVARDVMLNRNVGAKLDIQHISSKVTVDILRSAKKMGIKVYGEVTPQHLVATEDLVLERGSLARVNPPLRTESDRQALIAGLADGTIDMIATDHAPHSTEEKAREIKAAPSGMIGLETAFALIMKNVIATGQVSINKVIEALTVNPAKLYNLDAGYLSVGGPADIVIIDPDKEWIVPDTFASKASNSPFIGDEVQGEIKYTICGGNIVYKK
ncbi:MAG: dihydroorotase [Lachnospiraceae bacterium]|nr:dihydroorotase [Lachnospiraceae bacterium]